MRAWLILSLLVATSAAADPLKLAAEPATLHLVVTCDDPGAVLEVSADGEPIAAGRSPLRVDVLAGRFGLLARCPGGQLVDAWVAVEADAEHHLVCPPPPPPPPPERRVALPHGPVFSASRDWTAGGVMAGVGAGYADAAAVSWALGFDGPAPRWGGLYWSTARFRFVMTALGANEVLLAPTLSTLGGLAVSVPGGEVQVAAGPVGGLLILEDHDDRPGFVDGVAGGAVDAGFSHPLSVGAQDRVALWFGLEGSGLYAVDQARAVWLGLAAFRFEFLVRGR